MALAPYSMVVHFVKETQRLQTICNTLYVAHFNFLATKHSYWHASIVDFRQLKRLFLRSFYFRDAFVRPVITLRRQPSGLRSFQAAKARPKRTFYCSDIRKDKTDMDTHCQTNDDFRKPVCKHQQLVKDAISAFSIALHAFSALIFLVVKYDISNISNSILERKNPRIEVGEEFSVLERP